MADALVINEKDNVAVALRDIAAGSLVEVQDGTIVPAAEDIPYSHKLALEDIPAGQVILKYGEPIGKASRDIARGSWVHTHNIEASGEGAECAS
jgi:altronate hydrolase